MKLYRFAILYLLISQQIYAQVKSQVNDTLSIYYAIDKYKLSESNKDKIGLFTKQLDSLLTYKVQIISSADFLGSKEHNYILAAHRANEIIAYFNQLSGKISNFEIINKGEISELDKEKINHSIGNQENRKTTLVFIKEDVIRNKTEKKVFIYNPVKKAFDLKVGKKFILKNLIFHRSTSNIKHNSKRSLVKLLRFLRENPKVEIEIQGHLCCNAGEYQPDKSKVKPLGADNLSSKRAKLVYKYLVRNGIRSSRLTYHGYGFQSPLFYPEKAVKDKSLNKRVEIVITKY